MLTAHGASQRLPTRVFRSVALRAASALHLVVLKKLLMRMLSSGFRRFTMLESPVTGGKGAGEVGAGAYPLSVDLESAALAPTCADSYGSNGGIVKHIYSSIGIGNTLTPGVPVFVTITAGETDMSVGFDIDTRKGDPMARLVILPGEALAWSHCFRRAAEIAMAKSEGVITLYEDEPE
jgi:hypothetical protein